MKLLCVGLVGLVVGVVGLLPARSYDMVAGECRGVVEEYKIRFVLTPLRYPGGLVGLGGAD